MYFSSIYDVKRIFLISLFFIISVTNISVAAVTCSTTVPAGGCEAGCYENSGTCTPCPNGTFSPKNSKQSTACKNCENIPSGATSTGPGASEKSCPWTLTCSAGTEFNITSNQCTACTDGTISSTSVTIIYDGNGNITYNGYPTQKKCTACTDSRTEPNAAKTACVCKDNYTSNGTSCIGKCYKITLDKNLTNFPEQDKYLYVKYDDGFYKGNNCSGTKLTTTDEWLTPSFNWWQKFIGYSTAENSGEYRFGSTGKPTNGTTATTFTGNTTLYGQWNTNYYEVKYFDGDRQMDTNQQCTLSGTANDSPRGNNCPALTVSESNDSGLTIIGWSETKNDKNVKYKFNENIAPRESSQTINLYAVWDKCPAGYYCNATSGGKQPCPAGATSGEGKTKIDDCYISSATQFKDTNGKMFKLPIIGTIPYQP